MKRLIDWKQEIINYIAKDYNCAIQVDIIEEPFGIRILTRLRIFDKYNICFGAYIDNEDLKIEFFSNTISQYKIELRRFVKEQIKEMINKEVFNKEIT